MSLPTRSHAVLTALAMMALSVSAAPLTVTVKAPAAPITEGFNLGTARNPAGDAITVDSRSLLFNGRRWTPVMGEFHYTRYAASEWRGELRKMKAGGIEILATYVFWNHHEEIENQWNWSDARDLRRFVQLAQETGLKVIVRCGPWCHGEVRNGGVPDWAIAKGWKVRTDDPAYLDHVKVVYGQIAAQLKGLLWKEGGPVIGIQLENEYDGPAEHLLHLKEIAQSAGLDVPLYTRTGWPELKTPMPFGQIVPLYGAYSEGFWDRETTAMPGHYWAVFSFSTLRTDTNIANEALGRRNLQDPPDVGRYPYLTCEIGGGMMSSYHRRILVEPRDIETTTLVKLGSGSVSPGYYMYHGGINPESQLGTLNELQSTPMTNWNDLPTKNYDFQAPLGASGQIRPHYYLLRRLHLFLHEFGSTLAGMETFLPDHRPSGRDDNATLHWAARSDGQRGFVFVNNYERQKTLTAKPDVQFSLQLAGGAPVVFPAKPVTVPSGAAFIWPFNLDLGRGVTLAWATAQPLAVVDHGGIRTAYFTETPGIEALFASPGAAPWKLRAGRDSYRALRGPGGEVRVMLLNDADSLAFQRDTATGAVRFDVPPPPAKTLAVTAEPVTAAGPLRTITRGNISQPVAAAPVADDFKAAAVWRLKLPANYSPAKGLSLLRVNYTGDVLRLALNDRLIIDDFYNGRPLELDLRRYAAELKSGAEITVSILPLQRAAVTGANPLIYVPTAAMPDFAGADSIARINRVELTRGDEILIDGK